MQVTSSAFQDGETIPREYTADGKNISPPLAWKGAPGNTESYALICEDPDAPAGTWIHWLLYGIPAGVHELPAAASPGGTLPEGAREGKNSFGKLGYGGPAPPPGKVHRYYFNVYALDLPHDQAPPAGVGKQQLEGILKGHILAKGQLMGKYGR